MAALCGALAAILLLVGPPAAGGQAPASARVLARVKGVDITAADLERRLELLSRDRPVPAARHGDVLRLLIREEVLAQAAGGSGIEREAGVQARLAHARRQVLIEEFLRQKLAAAPSVTEDDLQQAYRANLLRFVTETVRVSHIMLPTAAEADAVRQELAAGKDFAEVARARSRDEGSAERGGDLGPILKGQTDPAFEAAAFGLQEGEVSGVVQTEQGFHILKGGVQGTTLRPFEEVREELRTSVAQAHQEAALQKILGELEQAAEVEILDERLR
jgi:parvulin-like peptidyl-prolyl isomerase